MASILKVVQITLPHKKAVLEKGVWRLLCFNWWESKECEGQILWESITSEIYRLKHNLAGTLKDVEACIVLHEDVKQCWMLFITCGNIGLKNQNWLAWLIQKMLEKRLRQEEGGYDSSSI